MKYFADTLLGYVESDPNKQISKKDYDLFCKEFVFDKLKGKRFGEAFCEKFDFKNFMLANVSDSTAKWHIETTGYIKDDSYSN